MSELQTLALKLGTHGPHKTLPTPRLIQALHNGHYFLKTTKAILVWEHPFYPQLYIPSSELLQQSNNNLKITLGQEFKSKSGTLLATQWILEIGSSNSSSPSSSIIDKVLAFSPTSLPPPAAQLSGLVKIDFASIDQWFEETTPIHIHPKDPFKRVDILQSTRHIVVKIGKTNGGGGVKVADTTTSMHLYETGLPPRYYLPFTSIIDARVLKKSSTRTKCPYKGEAEYFSVEVGGEVFEDVVWFYRTPLLESARIEGLCCFYNEKVHIEIDGEVQEVPESPFSNRKPNEKPSLD